MLSDDLHLITENEEQCILWRNNQLTYIAQNRNEIPNILATKFGQAAQRLDLSYNTLTSFKHIDQFVNLNELILDNNLLDDENFYLKPNLRLKTLSVNKNKLKHLNRLVENIKACCPNLEFLSLIGNPLCPGQIAASNEDKYTYQRYRFYVIYNLPNLKFLDSTKITTNEREESIRKGHYLLVRPEADKYSLKCVQATNSPSVASGVSSQFNDLQPKGIFSRLAYRYIGKNSEGNRFIKNNDL